MRRVEVPTYNATIYVGGNCWEADTIAQAYCDEVGMCVSLTETVFTYTDGQTDGVAIGFINYGRFPSKPEAIFAHAEALALRLIFGLDQDSASIVATDRTVWLSRREIDPAEVG